MNSNATVGMSIGLVLPFLSEGSTKNQFRYRECLALGYLTASLETAGYTVLSANCELLGLPPEAVIQQAFSDSLPNIVGISISSQRGYFAAKDLAYILKNASKDIHITCGGILPTTWHRAILEDCPAFDSVVRGEGEEAIVELADAVRSQRPLKDVAGITYRVGGGIYENKRRSRQAILDCLPFPARRDLQLLISRGQRIPSAYMVASRGCYAKCSFCSIHQIYGNRLVMRRSPARIIEEMALIQAEFDVNRFSFVDDLFVMPSNAGARWINEFCDLLEAKDLRIRFYAEMRADTIEAKLIKRLTAVGLDRIFIGIESGVSSVLRRMEKGTTVEQNERSIQILRDDIGIASASIRCGYIMFEPEMTYAELKSQYQWIRDSGLCRVQHLQNRMNVYWGTPMFEKMRLNGATEGVPFAERWFYEFGDPQVGQVEAVARRFLKRFEAELGDTVLGAKLLHQNGILYAKELVLPYWIYDVLDQALRRISSLERACWYRLFETTFKILDNQRLHLEHDEEVWISTEDLRYDITRESELLISICNGIRMSCTGDSSPLIGQITGTVATLALAGENGYSGYTATIGARGRDCFDHNCDVFYDMHMPFGVGNLTLENHVPRLNLLTPEARDLTWGLQ